jgi:hypothetical protein
MKYVPTAPARSTSGAAAGREGEASAGGPSNAFWEHNNSCFWVKSQGSMGGVKGEKPTGILTDFLLTVSDSYSALQRF